jgi:internalin A
LVRNEDDAVYHSNNGWGARDIFIIGPPVDIKLLKHHGQHLRHLALSNLDIDDDGAQIVASLASLTRLHVRNNHIGDDGACVLASLQSLASLDLKGNHIESTGARALASLASLIHLNLSNNKIGDDGLRFLATSPALNNLKGMDIRANGIKSLPEELLATQDAQAIFAAFRRIAKSKTRPLNEAKLLVVGNEAVGKTSLIRYITHGTPRDPDEQKTPGIFAHERIETLDWSPAGDSPTLHIWDFGGQEIMHETHKYFLTERSIYLLVLEDRREDDTSIYKWLKVIANRGGNSPVIVVINKCDDGQLKLLLDETSLMRDHPSVVAVMQTSCNPGEFAAASIARLQARIVTLLATDPRLEHVRDPFPDPWRRVKDALGIRARNERVLTHQDFIRLCETPSDSDKISDANEQRGLLRLLHDLGVVIAHGLSDDAPAAIQSVRLLDPNWLTGAIYKILTAGLVVQQGGVFLREHLSQLLPPDLYPQNRWEFILSMMQIDNMGLCFPLPGAPHIYLVPEALPRSEPRYEHWLTDSLHFRFSYEFLPSGLIPRLIVQAHQKLTDTRWRSGAVFVAADCPVLVRGNFEKSRVDIHVAGPTRMRRAALNVILEDLRYVHALNPEAKPEARVPLHGNSEATVSYDHLLRLEQLDGPDYTFLPEGGDRKYSVAELLDGVGREFPSATIPIYRRPTSQITIMLVSACPDEQKRLAVDREYRRLSSDLRASDYRDRIDLRVEPAADYDTLERVLRKVKPQILHLSCHGLVNGDILLADDRGGIESIPRDMLLNLLRLLTHDLKLVLINACHSHILADDLQQIVGVTVGMSDEISDAAAIAFTRKFYEILADGDTIQAAFDLACNKLRKYNEQTIPALYPALTDPAAEQRRQQRLLRMDR